MLLHTIKVELDILSTRYLHKKIAILFTFKRFIYGKDYKLSESKRENILYNIPFKYFYRSFGQYFIICLGPVYFNSMPCL